MTNLFASPTVATAMDDFLKALHDAYPKIRTDGVRPKDPGLFLGKVAHAEVELLPYKKAPRVILRLSRGDGASEERVDFEFEKLSAGLQYRWGDDNQEFVLLTWLLGATEELGAMAPSAQGYTLETAPRVRRYWRRS